MTLSNNQTAQKEEHCGMAGVRWRLVGAIVALAAIPFVGILGAAEPHGPESGAPADQWSVDYIDTIRTVGYGVSVAIDHETDESFVSYYEGNDGDLWLARSDPPGGGNCGPSNTWECQVVDTNGVVGKSSSIAVGGPGPSATLYISYSDVTRGALKILEGAVDRETGVLTYTRAIVDRGDPANDLWIGTRTAVAVDGDGVAHIAYRVELPAGVCAVKYAKRVEPGTGNCGEGAAEDAWQCENLELEFGIGEFVDIDVDAGGVPGIAYSWDKWGDYWPVSATQVASGGTCNSSDQWDCTPILSPGGVVPPYICKTGDWLSASKLGASPDLAYQNDTYAYLEIASEVGADMGNCGPLDDWDCSWIDETGISTMPSGIDLAHDPSGDKVIVYQDVEASNFDLKIARETAPGESCRPSAADGWRCELLDAGDLSHAEAVGGLSIAMNLFGEATVAYRELFDPIISPERGRLKVAMEPRADRTPDPFVFLDETGVPVGTHVTSNAITISGIDAPAPISITACTAATCAYSINGGAWRDEAFIVDDGTNVEVRQTSAATPGTTTDLTLTVGGPRHGASDTFSVTTEAAQHTLSIALTGDGSGSVSSAPPGINCPASTCSALFDPNETVTLTPAPDGGSLFAGWSGDADCADGVVETTADITCTATFSLDADLIFADGFESGTVTRWSRTAP